MMPIKLQASQDFTSYLAQTAPGALLQKTSWFFAKDSVVWESITAKPGA
jgi:hypothetical protein